LNLLDFTEASRSPALAQHLQIAFDKTTGRREISATVSEAVAESFNHKDPLARGGLAVVPRDIAGTRFEPVTF